MAKPPAAAPLSDPQIIDPNNELAVDFFLEENKGKILAAVVIALVALAAWAFFQYQQVQTGKEQSAAFFAAKAPDDWKALIVKYPGSLVAGHSQLLLADKLRDQNKLDEALQVLGDFTKSGATHPLIAQGWLSYAATLELKGETAKAQQAYATIAAQYGTTDAAPAALSAQARLAKTAGDTKKARETYQDIVTRFPASMWAQEAQQQIGQLPN
ncbi:MAG TPA: tetratricopeptide repeat protein [Chthoniobacterales bacterium]|jgi:outer membrane protein assembly factor BamD (BamD/ComL family)